MESFGYFFLITMTYLPLVLLLLGIISLIIGSFFKVRKKSGKKYFLTAVILLSSAMVVGLVPGLLLVFLVPH